jgi:transposase
MDLTATQIIEQYHGLWQVEESFRISKHDLKVRPIYHWTPDRIRAHIAICFMAFTCARHLSYRIRLQKEALSVEKIRQTLTNVQLSILKDKRTDKRYGIPSAISQEAKKIYHAVGLKISDVPFEIT